MPKRGSNTVCVSCSIDMGNPYALSLKGLCQGCSERSRREMLARQHAAGWAARKRDTARLVAQGVGEWGTDTPISESTPPPPAG